jgi:WD40 repeat protein
MTTQWETVRVFVSSTFNDMHAERDYLVKRVFPQLREWCEDRKLNLIDIDLRWGVTEHDALYSKTVVKVCLERIDDCRPFFLCFLGQRRGWVPREEDISKPTLEEFPGLREYAGNASVTEMEILHALVDPLGSAGSGADERQPASERLKSAFFYLRDDSYLAVLPADPPQLRQTYTNEGIADTAERSRDDALLKEWREQRAPATGRSVRHYQATWDVRQRTPELSIPLECPSRAAASLKRWREQWARAGVEVAGDSVASDSNQAKRAQAFNERFTAGRLTNFECGNRKLSDTILEDLRSAIAARFPDHMAAGVQAGLQKELDQQGRFLYAAGEGFIPRGDDFTSLDAYVDGDERWPFVLSAPGGTGKSALLANWIHRLRARHKMRSGDSVHFRFVGQSDGSTTLNALLRSLVQELKDVAGKLDCDIPTSSEAFRRELPGLLDEAGKHGRTVIVIDALDQLESGLSDLAWLPSLLPRNIRLVVSVRTDGTAAGEAIAGFVLGTVQSTVEPFGNLGDRRKLVRAYLEQYLKDLDEGQLESLVRSAGAQNPLFLKVVLSELRVFGVYASLEEKIRQDFGSTPDSAFAGLLERLEDDPAYSPIAPNEAVPLIFGLLAHARQGLLASEIAELVLEALKWDPDAANRQAALDTVNLYLRQVRPFLANRDGRYDFFFESFRLAARHRYEEAGPQGRSARDWHGLIARHLSAQPLFVEGSLARPNLRKCFEQPYQQVRAGLRDDAAATLSDPLFIDAKSRAGMLDDLLSDYDTVSALEPRPADYSPVDSLFHTLKLEQHHLRAYPNDAFQYVYNRLRLLGDVNGGILGNALTSYIRLGGKLLELVGEPSRPGPQELLTYSSPAAISAFAVSPDGSQVCSAFGSTMASWDPTTGRTLATFTGHTDTVTCCAFSPDGKVVLSGSGATVPGQSQDNTVRLWDSRTGECLMVLSGHSGLVKYCAILRTNTVVSHGQDNVLIFWNLSTGTAQKSMRTSTRLFDEVECIFSADGHYMLVAITRNVDETETRFFGSFTQTVELWDMLSGTKRSMVDRHYHGDLELVQCAFSANGRFMAVSGTGGWLKLWDTDTGEELGALTGHKCRSPAVLADGGGILFACGDSKVAVWEVHSNQVATITTSHKGGVSLCAVFPDDQTFATVGADRTVKLWKRWGASAESYSSPDGAATRGHEGIVRSCAFSSDGLLLVSGGDDATLKLWDGATARAIATLQGKSGEIRCCGFSPDGGRLVSGGADRMVRLWDTHRGHQLAELQGHTSTVTSCSFSPDGSSILSSGGDATLLLWDVASGQIIHRLDGHLASVETCAYSPDGALIVSGGYDNTVRIWDAHTGRQLHVLMGHTDCVRSCAFSPDGTLIVSGGYDNLARIWDVGTWNEVVTLSGHEHAVESCCLAGGGVAVTGSRDNTVRLWHAGTGEVLATLCLDAAISSVCVAPAGMLIAYGDATGGLGLLKPRGL